MKKQKANSLEVKFKNFTLKICFKNFALFFIKSRICTFFHNVPKLHFFSQSPKFALFFITTHYGQQLVDRTRPFIICEALNSIYAKIVSLAKFQAN